MVSRRHCWRWASRFIVHLLQQHKSNPLPFSSLMFFEKRTQSSVKHRRLKYHRSARDALRCCLLCSRFCLPSRIVRRASGGDAQGRKMLLRCCRQLVQHAAGTRMADAKNAAIDVLRQFRGGDRGQVISFASSAQLLTQAVTNPQELEAAVQTIEPGDGRSAYAEIARVIRSLGNARRHARGGAHLHGRSKIVHACPVFRTRRPSRNEAGRSFRCGSDRAELVCRSGACAAKCLSTEEGSCSGRDRRLRNRCSRH